MINLYKALVEYEGGNWRRYLEELALLDVFGELFDEFTAPESMRKIVRYIVWTYSVNSDRIIGGMDWENNKRNNFDQAALPSDLWEAIGQLKDKAVLWTVQRWLEFQDDAVFKQLQCLRDLKMEMQLSSVGRIMKSGEVDYDQKFKNANYAFELEKLIQQLENQSLVNNPSLKEGLRETKFQRRIVTTGPESFAKS